MRTALVIGAVIVLIGVLAIAAILLAGGDDDDDAASDVSSSPGATAEVGAGAGDGDGDDGADAESGGDGADAGPIDPFEAAVEVTGDNLAPLEDPTNDPAIGVAAPTLSGTNYAGEPVELRPGSDGPTMVVFLAHWCPHCNDEIPVLNEWRDSGAIPENLRIVGVSTAVSDERPNFPPGEWLVEKDWQWDVIADGSDARAMDAYGVTGFPFFVMLDADGNVVARGSGEQPIEVLEQLAAAATA
jgi:thiol-disulfide isomerase/thioredoxin